VDFNADGKVDLVDLVMLIENWGTDDPLYDIGPYAWGDGVVDEADLEVLMSHWGEEIGLVAHWKLDEAEGGTAQDSAGDCDGTLYGDPLWQPDGGTEGGALLFDGVDDYIQTPCVLNPAAGPFSVVAWVNGGTPGQVILSQAGGASWLTASADGTLATELTSSRGGYPLVSSAVVTDDNWHRVGLTWEDQKRTLYVDDVEVAKDTHVQANVSQATGGIHIGAGKGLEPGTFFSGLIDDVQICNRAVQSVVRP